MKIISQKNATVSVHRIRACRSAKEKKYLCSPFIFAGPSLADMFVRKDNFHASSFRFLGEPEHIGDIQSCTFLKSLRPKGLKVSTDKINTHFQRVLPWHCEMRIENNFLNPVSF